MIRLLLVVALAIAAWTFIPETRAFVTDLARPALTPVFRWQAQQEMTSIAHELQLYERENFGQLPDARRFPTWLQSSFNGDATVDSWGAPYSIRLSRDSFAIVSLGPDGLPDSPDDLRIVERRTGLTRR